MTIMTPVDALPEVSKREDVTGLIGKTVTFYDPDTHAPTTVKVETVNHPRGRGPLCTVNHGTNAVDIWVGATYRVHP